MEDSAPFILTIVPLLGFAWAVTCILLVFKIWGACNRITEIRDDARRVANIQADRDQALFAEARQTNALLTKILSR